MKQKSSGVSVDIRDREVLDSVQDLERPRDELMRHAFILLVAIRVRKTQPLGRVSRTSFALDELGELTRATELDGAPEESLCFELEPLGDE